MKRVLSVVVLGLLTGQQAVALSPKCAELPGDYPASEDNHAFAQCWQELDEQPGCHVYRGHYHSDEVVRGTGDCRGGLVKRGMLTIECNGNVLEGPYVDSKQNGHWVLRYADGALRRWLAPSRR